MGATERRGQAEPLLLIAQVFSTTGADGYMDVEPGHQSLVHELQKSAMVRPRPLHSARPPTLAKPFFRQRDLQTTFHGLPSGTLCGRIDVGGNL